MLVTVLAGRRELSSSADEMVQLPSMDTQFVLA